VRLLAQPEAGAFQESRAYAGPQIAEVSPAIRRHGALVGWIMAIPLSAGWQHQDGVGQTTGAGTCAQAVVYKECYVDAALWHTGVAIGGFFHSFSVQVRVFGEESTWFKSG